MFFSEQTNLKTYPNASGASVFLNGSEINIYIPKRFGVVCFFNEMELNIYNPNLFICC